MRIDAREAALKALGKYRRGESLPDQALEKLTEGMPPRDAALAAQLLFGVLQNMALLDYYASEFSTIRLNKLEPRVLDILRLSIYQIAFLDKIPHNAAVSEGVSLTAKHSNRRAAGFVNAVLRSAASAAGGGRLPAVDSGSESRKLSITYSHPEWFVQELCSSLGPGGAEQLLSANNAAGIPVTAQVNTLLAGTEEALAMLEYDGADASAHGWLDGCISMRGAGPVARLSAFQKGLIYIQDAAARLAVAAAAPAPGMTVIDGCASPGGKSFAAAVAMKNTGSILACDITESKLRRIEEGARRLGIGIIKAMNNNALEHASEFDGIADIVFADVPCSGFGVIRKKPEIRYKSEQAIASLAEIQKNILLRLSAYVRPGGTLLYSTCSVLRRENEAVAEWFLDAVDSFALDGFELPHIGGAPGGMCTLWPHIHGTDGFFICKFRRRV